VISVGFGRGREGTDFASTYNAQNGPRIYAHSWEEITSLFDGLELVPPGIAETSEWHPGQPGGAVGDRESMIVAGVARRPLTPAGTRKDTGHGWRPRTGGHDRWQRQHWPEPPHKHHRLRPLPGLASSTARAAT